MSRAESQRGGFWANRRKAVQAEARAEEVALEDRAIAEQHAELEAKTDDEILAELELPDPDALVQGDDFSVFLQKAVPDRIRRRALRRLWVSNPVLANLDELIDYGEDYSDAATVIENMQTAYQVGKGMTKHVEEMARQAEAELLEAEGGIDGDTEEDQTLALSEPATEDETFDEASPDATPETIAETDAETADDPETETGLAVDAPENTTPPILPGPSRRMRFEYAG